MPDDVVTEDEFDRLMNGDDPSDDSDRREQRTNSEWARLRQTEKKVRDRDDKIKKLERQLAFRDAGINPADEDAPPHTQMFVDNYSGELTADAIKAEAVRMRILKPETPDATTDPQVQAQNAETAEGLAKVDAASEGATPPDGGDPINRVDEAYLKGGDAALEEAVRQAGYPVRYSS